MDRNLGIAALLLSAIAIAAIVVDLRHESKPATPVTPPEVIDKLVIDYAFQVMESLSKGAVSSCGTELAGQEADVTARVSVANQTLTFTSVRFVKSEWNPPLMDCVTKAFEGQKREPKADNVRTKFPDNAEYEFEAHLAFATPTLQYTP
ncbi:MAG: hypothetical protein GQE15_12310 [Archangiaceae bacterium]|nr:hypothetical protein [Archangiaceae bacterium]